MMLGYLFWDGFAVVASCSPCKVRLLWVNAMPCTTTNWAWCYGALFHILPCRSWSHKTMCYSARCLANCDPFSVYPTALGCREWHFATETPCWPSSVGCVSLWGEPQQLSSNLDREDGEDLQVAMTACDRVPKQAALALSLSHRLCCSLATVCLEGGHGTQPMLLCKQRLAFLRNLSHSYLIHVLSFIPVHSLDLQTIAFPNFKRKLNVTCPCDFVTLTAALGRLWGLHVRKES